VENLFAIISFKHDCHHVCDMASEWIHDDVVGKTYSIIQSEAKKSTKQFVSHNLYPSTLHLSLDTYMTLK
jgi:hypothetical protein